MDPETSLDPNSRLDGVGPDTSLTETTYLGGPSDWGFWMLSSARGAPDKRQQMRDRLEAANLRPTWQRMNIGLWVFEPPTKHFTPEDLFRRMQSDDGEGVDRDTRARGRPISLATIYNTLNAFADAQLLRVFAVQSGKRYYDTNTTPHAHLHDPAGKLELIDVPLNDLVVNMLPNLPEGYTIDEVVVTLRLTQETDKT